MVTTNTFAHADRLHSFELLAAAAGLGSTGPSITSAVAAG
jgi:hypothetical protein